MTHEAPPLCQHVLALSDLPISSTPYRPVSFQALQTTGPSSQLSSSSPLERHVRGLLNLTWDRNILQARRLLPPTLHTTASTHVHVHGSPPRPLLLPFNIDHWWPLRVLGSSGTLQSIVACGSQALVTADPYHTKSPNYQTCFGPSTDRRSRSICGGDFSKQLRTASSSASILSRLPDNRVPVCSTVTSH